MDRLAKVGGVGLAILGLGATVAGVGLPLIGVPIPPLVGWLLVGSGIVLMVLGGALIVYAVLCIKSNNVAEKPKERPLQLAFQVKQLRRLTLNDRILGGGPEEDVEVLTDILFTPKRPPVKPLQVMLELHSKRIPAGTLMGDITGQVSQPYFFIVPKALAKDTVGRIIVTTDQGTMCSESQMIRFANKP